MVSHTLLNVIIIARISAKGNHLAIQWTELKEEAIISDSYGF